MIGSATIPITYQEFLELFDQPNPVLYYSGLTMDWFTTLNRNPAVTEQAFETMRVRILNQDYRHYFGEVVDLKDIYGQTYDCWTKYLGHEFLIWRYSDCYKVEDKNGKALYKGAEAECKQWLADHFTELIKKDLPHTNIKFIFS
jgi:hemerythrin